MGDHGEGRTTQEIKEKGGAGESSWSEYGESAWCRHGARGVAKERVVSPREPIGAMRAGRISVLRWR